MGNSDEFWTAADQPCREAWAKKAGKSFGPVTWKESMKFVKKDAHEKPTAFGEPLPDAPATSIQLVGTSAFEMNYTVNGKRPTVPVEFMCRYEIATKKTCVWTMNESQALACD
jgi:hypothetical protein